MAARDISRRIFLFRRETHQLLAFCVCWGRGVNRNYGRGRRGAALEAAIQSGAKQLNLLAEAGWAVALLLLDAAAPPVSKEANAVAIAVDEGEEDGKGAEDNDDYDQLEDGEGGEGDGAAVAGRLVVEDVAGGAGGVGPV